MFLVSGGSGYCGFEIVRHLVQRKERVRVLDLEPLPEAVDGVEFIRGDIRDLTTVEKACKGISRIIHTAAKVPISKAGREFWEVNVEGTRNLLEVALKQGVDKFVHVSTSAVQFSDQNPVDEQAPYRPIGPYARSKMEAELLCKQYLKKGLPIDIVRPRTVVGPGRLGIFDILFDWIYEGRKIFIVGKGSNRIQFLHPEDLATCCYLCSLREDSDIFNIGSREFSTLREDLGFLLRYAGTRNRIVSLPVLPATALLSLLDFLRLSPLTSWHYLTLHRDFYYSNDRAKTRLGWEPHYGNGEALRLAYDDYVTRSRAIRPAYGYGHRNSLRQGILALVKCLSK